VAVALQLFTVDETVYVVDVEGEAVTEARFETLSPVVGVHEYVAPPEAVKLTELPLQIVADAGEILNVGPALMQVAAAYLALILFPG
jgi:hypothetical protein